jgi:hypothetical protein
MMPFAEGDAEMARKSSARSSATMTGTDDELSLGHKYFSPSEFPTRLPRFSNDNEAAGVFTLSLEKPYFALDME